MSAITTAAPADLELVTAYVSGTRIGHLDLKCSGLDRMREAGRDPETTLEPVTGTSLLEVFDQTGPSGDPAVVFPCRLCAYEAVVACVLALPSDPALGTRFVVTGLQRSTRNPGKNQRVSLNEAEAERRRELHQLAYDRLLRMADLAGCSVAHTPVGPILYGHLPLMVSLALPYYTSVDILTEANGLPGAEQMAAYWVLRHTSELEPSDLWEITAGMWAPAL